MASAALGTMVSVATLANFMETELKTINLKDEKEDYIPVHSNLAAAFGKLNSETIKAIDDNLKVMISGTLRDLGKHDLKSKRLTWSEVQSIFNQNMLLEKVPESSVDILKTYHRTDNNDWQFDGSPDHNIVQDVEKWFNEELVTDADVRADTKINIKSLSNIVAQTGATVTSFLNFFHKHEVHRRTIVEIGVLRFPDVDNPFFKVYRIRLTAWSDSTRTLFHQEDRNGIEGEFNACKYRPRESVLNQMRKEVLGDAVKEAEDIFN